jgi:transcriptional regulator with XRE-family HTH domain
MPDWKRLGDHVIARRAEYGWTRQQLADASHISTRILGDIETGRRGNFDRTTLARLEQALNWRIGSAQAIAEGSQAAQADSIGLGRNTRTQEPVSERDQLIISIMERDDITDGQKAEIVGILIAQKEANERALQARREADEQAREETARRLIAMLARPD